MPKTKVIVDSDDESDDGDTHVSVESDDEQAHEDAGEDQTMVSSEEALNEQIREAHESLLAATPIAHKVHTHTITVPLKDADRSPHTSGKKRRARSLNNERDGDSHLRTDESAFDLRSSSDGEMKENRRKRAKYTRDSASMMSPSSATLKANGNPAPFSEQLGDSPMGTDSSLRQDCTQAANGRFLKQRDTDSEGDELNDSYGRTGSSHAAENTDMSQKRNRKAAQKPQGDDLGDELGSEDSTIGFPKEQYQPRPSRSRSRRNGNLVEPVDFSKRPETVAKSVKMIRSSPSEMKHEASVDQVTVPDTLEEVPQENPDETKPEADVVHEMGSEANELSKSSKKQRGRPKKGATIEAKLVDDNSTEIQASVQTDNDTDRRNAKSPKKRGRPSKKSTNVTEAPARAEPMDLHPPDEVVEQQDAPLQETDANVSPMKRPTEVKIVTELLEQVSTPPKVQSVASSKQSPTGQNGQTFRVGLSKRARIQPLLKIVRK